MNKRMVLGLVALVLVAVGCRVEMPDGTFVDCGGGGGDMGLGGGAAASSNDSSSSATTSASSSSSSSVTSVSAASEVNCNGVTETPCRRLVFYQYPEGTTCSSYILSNKYPCDNHPGYCVEGVCLECTEEGAQAECGIGQLCMNSACVTTLVVR